MTRIKTTHNRRSFLKASALAGGGMALGFNWLVGCKPAKVAGEAAVAEAVPASWFEVNAFLKIADSGKVTIMSPNPEIGQNVKTSMPMIVAEELDVAWEDVIVEQAGLDTENFRRQLAGGSQSIRQGWNGLRMAGATARRMLLEAAAQKWQVPVGELTTSEGKVMHASTDKSISYGALAAAAAEVKVPEEVSLKDPKDFKIIGTSRKNVDGPSIVTGAPLYGLDTYREGMKIAMIVHPPAFGLKFKGVDVKKIKEMPGVEDVFPVTVMPDHVKRQWSDVQAFSQQIALVGDSTWALIKAKRALKAQWTEASKGENTEDHEQKMTALLRKLPEKAARKDGDAEAVLRRAAKVVERTYSAPFLAHNTMEPMNFFADVTAEKAELIGPIQTPASMQTTLSKVLDMDKSQISIMMTRMGGGFGRRLYGHFGIEAAVISKKIGAPVKLVYTREDDMTQGVYRPTYKVTYRAGLDKDNKLVAFHVKGAGIPSSPIFPNRFPAGTLDNYLAETLEAETNISTGAWRAPRSNFIAGAEQSFLDEVAEEAGKDPIEFRLELFQRAIDDPVGKRNDYDAERYAGVLKLVREKSGWDQKRSGVYRGVSAYYCHNSYVAQVLDIVMEGGKPRIKKVWCAVDCGIVVNPDAALNQIEGGIIDGIGHAMYSGLTFKDGKPEQDNFNRYRLIRHAEAPIEIETFFVDNGIDPTGLGEPSLPPISAALANAMYKATGKRLYHQPFMSKSQA